MINSAQNQTTESTYIEPSVSRCCNALIACTILDLVKNVPGARGLFPEPFDIFDHIGNGSQSFALGAIWGSYVLDEFVIIGDGTGEKNSIKKVKRRLAACGLAAGLLINSIAESRLGTGLPFLNRSTPDMIDAAYGAVGMAFGAATITKVRRRRKYE